MSAQVEKLEKSMVKLTIEVSADEFEKGIDFAYNKNKGKITMPGFRKGKVPRSYIEKMYGVEFFYEDAVNHLLPDAYANAVEELNVDVVAQPEIDVTQVERGKNLIFTATVAVKPEVTLGQYKELEINKIIVEVSDEDIEKEIKHAQEQNSRTITITDRAVQDGDIAVIDYEGFVDGVAFEGGKGEGHQLTIGSHSFIDSFEEQLIGKNIGEDVDVNVTFPTPYHSKDLEGKPAVFKVKINEIKAVELPQVDDEFAQDVSEFDTLAEYKEDIKAKLTEEKQKAAKSSKENAVVEKVVENATFEVPEPMIDQEVNSMLEEFAQRIKYQGISLEQYFAITGSTEEAFKEQVRPEALKRIQGNLCLEAIAKAENITVSDEDFEAELVRMADMYKMELQKVKDTIKGYAEIQIKESLKVQKALDLITATAKEA